MNPTLTHSVTDAIEIKIKNSVKLRLRSSRPYTLIKKHRNIKAKTTFGISLRGAGITPDDEENFDDLKYIDIEFEAVSGMSSGFDPHN